jgi:hypothetical protein
MLIVGWNTYAADIYVNNSGQAGTYTTISAAITAAVAGDKIYVSPYGVYTENLAIAKSLTIVSAVPNTRFSVVGNVTITSAPTQEVIIIGGEFSSNINGNTGTATLASKGFICVSDCKFNSANCSDYLVSKLLFSEFTDVNLRNGIVIGSKINNITVDDGPNTGIGDTIKIIGNKISAAITWNNDDNYFFISNNVMISSNTSVLGLSRHLFNVSKNNLILNNSLQGAYCSNCGNQGLVGISSVNNRSNIHFYNNIIQTNGPCLYATNSTSAALLYYNYIFCPGGNNGYYSLTTGNNAIYTNPSGVNMLTLDELGKSTNTTYVVNQGSPALQYYDIDLTRNDIGTFGGPYSIDNYWNTATGRARVYDLNMPFEIWNGSTPSIKAEGTHIK